MCYYETIEGEKKDLAPLILSKKELNIIIKNYPETDYAYDARFKIDLINSSKVTFQNKIKIVTDIINPAVNADINFAPSLHEIKRSRLISYRCLIPH